MSEKPMSEKTEKPSLTESDKTAIVEILLRRSNEIASFKMDLEAKTSTKFYELPGSVELALTREISRLRKIADKLTPAKKEEEDSDL